MFHELYHIVCQTSGIDLLNDSFLKAYANDTNVAIERTCNRFAGEFLVPDDDFNFVTKGKKPIDSYISELSKTYGVSREVILRKFLDRKKISEKYYDEKRQEYNSDYFRAKIKNQEGKKSQGDYYNTQIVYKGKQYLGLTYGKYYNKKITITQLARYMNMKIPSIEALAAKKGWGSVMMIFVVDTNVFSKALRNVSLDVFYDIWEPWAALMDNGQIISVDEVFLELQSDWGDKAKEMQWLNKHKSSFQNTTNKEGYIVAEIFKNNKYREGIKEKSLRSGSPEADAFLVAKAKAVGGIIVTAESDQKPHSEKIPNMCIDFDVPYIVLNEFYMMLRNLYQGKSQLLNVGICYELGKSTIVEEHNVDI